MKNTPLQNRRKFIKSSMAVAGLMVSSGLSGLQAASPRKALIKTSLNFFSYNKLLQSGELSLGEAIDHCSETGFEAADITGYYFKGYPEVPSTAYVHEIKKRAFLGGLDISGTGVRTTFTSRDPKVVQENIDLVKAWVHVAAEMDAPVLRVFSGKSFDGDEGFEDAKGRIAEALKICAQYGQKYGVMIVLQNHNDTLKTVDQVLEILKLVDEPWLGVNLDVGSLRAGDPYEEIARLAPYAYTWQLKQLVYRNGVAEPVDCDKFVKILHDVGYRGYVPIETLGPGDAREKLPAFLQEFELALANYKA